MRRLACTGVVIALFVPSQEVEIPRAGRPFTERFECEGKCCSFGRVAELRVPVFAGPGAPTTLVGWLEPSDTVHTDNSILRWRRVGAIVMLREFKYYSEDEDPLVVRTLVAGDTIPVLGYQMEGRYEIWHENAKRYVMEFWNDGRSWPPMVNPPARLLYEGQSTWWLRVKGLNGPRGWIVSSGKLRQLTPVCP